MLELASSNPTPALHRPPHNLEAEKSVLGAPFIKTSALGEVVAAGLKVDDFFLPVHREIFAAMLAIDKRQQALDIVTVAAELKARGMLGRLDGGEAHLVALANACPTAEHALHYARLVQDDARLRKASTELSFIHGRLVGGARPDEVLEGLRIVVSGLDVGDDGRERWPQPTPIREGLPAVPAFPERLLPEALRLWIADAADRMQCAPDFIAAPAMVALGAIVGRSCAIKPRRKDDWIVVPNLWGAVVSRSGLMKTPALEVALAPLRRLAARESERNLTALKNYEFRLQVAEARKAEARKRLGKATPEELIGLREELEAEIDAPAARRFEVNDSTVEKLGAILKDNPRGVLNYRDELTGWLASMTRDGHEGDRAFFLEGWSGLGSYTFDRIGRGTTQIPALCLSVLGGIQPAPLGMHLRSMLRGGQAADGLLQRFQLTVWPDVASWKPVDRWPDSDARQRANDAFERLATFTPDMLGTELDAYDPIPALRFDDAAQELFDEWLGDLERRLRAGAEHEAFESHLSKYRKLLPALALLIHLADSPMPPGPVTVAAAQRAAAWCDFLEAHARRLYASVMQQDDVSALALLTKIRSGEAKVPLVARDIYRRCWSGLSSLEDVEGALSVLDAHGYIRRTEEATKGRTAIKYAVHPSLRTEGSAR
jgi:Protein of unknown function (DUF3987)/DnaB-like helicase N terminal domain